MRPRFLFLFFFLCAVLLGGCMSPATNRIENGDFEAEEAWFWLQEQPHWVAPFTFEDASPLKGDRSLRTTLDVDLDGADTAIVGAIQELAGPLHPPERIQGQWRAMEWDGNASRRYIQVVVSITADPEAEGSWCHGVSRSAPCQVAFVLAGIAQRPFNIANREFVFTNGPARAGGLQTFDLPVGDVFVEAWGLDASTVGSWRIYLEARAEEAPGGHGNARMDILWDSIRVT